MDFNIKKITGKIIVNSEVIGTGFLVTNNLFITARHNVHKNRYGKPSEKEIIITFDDKEVRGNTLNLIEAYDKKIDVVFIKLGEPIFDIDLTKIIKSYNSLKGYEFNSYGYPKENSEGYYLEGTVLSDEETENSINISLDVKEEYFLMGYHGLSGAPIYVNDFLVGILIAQETEKKLFGISFDLIEKEMEDLSDGIFPLEEKKLKNISFKNVSQIIKKLDNDFFHSHIDEAFKIAGPRYSQELNIENPTSKGLQIFSGEYDFSENLKEKIKDLASHLSHLKKSATSDSYTQATPFCEESNNKVVWIEEIFEKILSELRYLVISGVSEEKIDFFDQLDGTLSKLAEKLRFIFDLELKRFEAKHGEGNFENKKWREFMASYQCTFPTANLDTVKELISLIGELKSDFSSNPLKLYFSKALLLKGRGGIGKTHSLCDIVNHNIKNNLPSLIFFGQYFRDKSPEEVILEKLSLNNTDFESLLYKLDIIGDRVNKNILICIDAINETTDKTYWNDYLTSFTEKIQKYKHVKLAISCRSLYLDEVLNEGISEKYLIKEHKGFEDIGTKAILQYFKYYGLNIPHVNKMQKEFTNPLFLKLYCEVLSEVRIDNPDFNIDGLNSLFENFFKIKNQKISKKFSDYISPRDNVIGECIIRISNVMRVKKLNFLRWKEVKKIIKIFLLEELEEDNLSPKLILDELISENILKEDIIEENTLSFSFERFFDYLMAKNIIISDNLSIMLDNIQNFQNNLSVYKGALELLMILYKEKYNKELIEEYDLKDPVFYELFLSSLSWRKNTNIDVGTKYLFEYCLKMSGDRDVTEKSLFTLYELSLKDNCIINAEYFHSLFKYQRIYEKDVFLGYWMLKSHEKYTIVDKIINNSIYLKEKNIDFNIIKLWIVILGWFTSLNDINIRDRASKGLTNLLKLYPESIVYTIEKFESVNDDYIQERVWGAVYASLILNRETKRIEEVVEYIHTNYVKEAYFPENVIFRDMLRNITELAKTMNILKYDIALFRPPYKSRKIEKSDKSYDKIQEEYKNLFWNCTESDFGVYTIPSEVQNYGFNKKEVGILVYNEIVNNYYSSRIADLDGYIDYTYGSLRSRDESIERVSKKYQNINLNRVLGRIYDNYPYEPKWRYDDEKEVIPNEQGNKFRSIDLTSLLYEKLDYDFSGNSIDYDFRKVSCLSYSEWFSKEDITEIPLTLIENSYFDEEYLLLKGYLESEKSNTGLEDYPKQRLWFQIRSYLVKIDEVSVFKDWIKDKHFWGQWMPTGYEHFYEGWIGEYPWSASYVNVLEEEEIENCDAEVDATKDYEEFDPKKHYETLSPDIKSIWDEIGLSEKVVVENNDNINNYNDDKTPPVDLISTVNDFNNEKDSEFCKPEIGKHFLFPGEFFFKKLELEWNGQNVYFHNCKPFFIVGSGKDSAIYVNKKLLNEFLEENGYIIVWTVLGEKQVIKGGFGGGFTGSAEFSLTFTYDSNKVLPNHYYYKAVNSKNDIVAEKNIQY